MTTNKVSRVLGAAFLLQFITSFFFSGVLLKPLWLVQGDIDATMLKIAQNPAILRANIFVKTRRKEASCTMYGSTIIIFNEKEYDNEDI